MLFLAAISGPGSRCVTPKSCGFMGFLSAFRNLGISRTAIWKERVNSAYSVCFLNLLEFREVLVCVFVVLIVVWRVRFVLMVRANACL